MSIAAPSALIRILIVDDTPTIRLLFQRMFATSGVFDVVGEAGSGHEGLELARQHQPDVILLDLAMPVVDGLHAIPLMVDSCPDSLIVVLSGFSADSSAAQALALGAHAFIEKRYRPDELLRQIVDIYRSKMANRMTGAVDPVAVDHVVHDHVVHDHVVHERRSLPPPSANGRVDVPVPVIAPPTPIEPESSTEPQTSVGAPAVVAAHDLRSPLEIIVGFSELLATAYAGQLDDEARDMLASIVSGVHVMDGMLDGLVVHCGLDAAEPSVVEVSLDDVIRSAIKQLGPQIEGRNAAVTVDPMPWVVGDAAQLQILFQNLVANSLKFVRPGDVPRVHITAARIVDGWRITVEDNGIGILAADREQIFGMFVRLHPHGDFAGAGIGLATSRRIVDTHGGTIRADENPTGGSRFVVDLPDREPMPGSSPTAAVVAGEGSVDSDGEPARPLDILLVEDSIEHAKLVRALLRRAPAPGYRLHHVVSLADARHLLASSEMDCVLLDLSLPDSRDLDALSELRLAAPMVAIVVITSSSDEGLAFAAVSQGAQDYLVKGHLDSGHLFRAVRWALQRKTLENELTRDALHDPLTRLPNRTLMLDRLASALARAERSSKKVVVFFIDLDGFKLVNDRFGHEAGDQFLIEMAERLRGAVRPQDTVARIGGDEFVVICEGFTGDEAEWRPLQERLTAAVEVPMEIVGQSVSVSASVGLAVGGRNSEPEAMLRDADLAMYAVKRAR